LTVVIRSRPTDLLLRELKSNWPYKLSA